MTFPVLLDTCTIFGAALNDFLLTLAERGAFRALWSGDIMAELRRNLAKRGIDSDAIDRRIENMIDAFPDAMVTGYSELVAGLTCEEKDRHVLAAAVRGGAAVIVTFNTGAFPPQSLESYDIEAVNPDDFLLAQLDLYPALVVHALHDTAAHYERPPMTPEDFLGRLTRCGVPRFVAAVLPLL